MKIVVISRCIYPRLSPRSFRATELAKYFASRGHEVYLYGALGKFNYIPFEEETGVHVCSLGNMYFSTLNSESYIRRTFLDRLSKRLFGRLLEWPDIELTWRTKQVIEKLTDIDLLVTITNPFPIHWGAAWAKIIMKDRFPKVWISDCGDPYMGNSVKKRPPSYFQIIEDFWGRQTDYITIPIEEGRSAYSSLVQNKIRIVPQGFNFTDVCIDNTFKGNSAPHFAYTGAVYPGYRDPTKMLEYLSTLKELNFHFTIYTRDSEYFTKYKQLLGDKLELKSYIPREKLIFELSQNDFLINLKNNNTVQSPSKLIDYYLSKRPIIDISSDFNERTTLNEFLIGNYSGQHLNKDISKYDIRNVGQCFLNLANK